MSIESAKSFIERMKTDEAFAKKVIACKDAGMRMSVIEGEGFDFTTEEITALRSELSDEELDAVSGGVDSFCGFGVYGSPMVQ